MIVSPEAVDFVSSAYKCSLGLELLYERVVGEEVEAKSAAENRVG